MLPCALWQAKVIPPLPSPPWGILVILSHNCLHWSKAERRRQHQQDLSCFPGKGHHERSCAVGLKRQLEVRSPPNGFGWSKWPLGLHITDLIQSRWYEQAFVFSYVCGVLRCSWHALVSGQGAKNFASGFNGNQESSKKCLRKILRSVCFLMLTEKRCPSRVR